MCNNFECNSHINKYQRIAAGWSELLRIPTCLIAANIISS